MLSLNAPDIVSDHLLTWTVCAIAIFIVWETLATVLIVRRKPNIPLVGTSFPFMPRFILNLKYAWNIADIAEEGFKKVSSTLYPGGGCWMLTSET